MKASHFRILLLLPTFHNSRTSYTDFPVFIRAKFSPIFNIDNLQKQDVCQMIIPFVVHLKSSSSLCGIIINVVVVVVILVVEIDLYKFCRLQSRRFF